MLSKLGGTVTALPPGMTEFPMFPGMCLITFQLFVGKFSLNSTLP